MVKQVGRDLIAKHGQEILRQVAKTHFKTASELAPELFPHIADPMDGARRKWQIEEELEAAGMLKPMPGLVELLEKISKTHLLAICSSSRPEPI